MRIVMFASICSLAVSVLLSGCSSVSNIFDMGDTAAGNVKIHDTRNIIERRLSEGSLEKAHSVLKKALRSGVTETALSGVYTKVENSLLREAQKYGDEGYYEKAALFYRMAMDTYPKNPQLMALLLMSKEDIKKMIGKCADELMNSGLIAYREGKLVEAVALWEKITIFAPHHTPSNVAIITTKQQIEALERLTPDNVN